MAKIYNSELTQNLAHNAGIQQSVERTPNELAEKIVPVIETNPQLLRIQNWGYNGILNNATSLTLSTVSTTQDTYITHATLSLCKDATATCTYVKLYATNQYGSATNLAYIGCLALTAQEQNMVVDFSRVPFLVKRGSTIYCAADTNVGNFRAVISLNGFRVENPDI